VSGDYAYVAHSFSGLSIVDIRRPSTPVLKGSCDTGGHAWGVAVSGNYAYVADGDNGLVIVDVSDKSDPKNVGAYNNADWVDFAYNVAVSGDYAYVADWDNGLVIVELVLVSTDDDNDDGFLPGFELALLVAVVGVVVITSKRKREYAYQERVSSKSLHNPTPSPLSPKRSFSDKRKNYNLLRVIKPLV